MRLADLFRRAKLTGCRLPKNRTLDDNSRFQPQFHVWCDTKQNWVDIPDGISSNAAKSRLALGAAQHRPGANWGYQVLPDNPRLTP